MKCLDFIYDQNEVDQAVASESLARADGLEGTGECLAEALGRLPVPTSVRVRNGKVSVSDGPFVETKE